MSELDKCLIGIIAILTTGNGLLICLVDYLTRHKKGGDE